MPICGSYENGLNHSITFQLMVCYYYSSVTHPFEADCTFFMYCRTQQNNIKMMLSAITCRNQNLFLKLQKTTNLIKNTPLSLVCRGGPSLSPLLHLGISQLNIHSPLANINCNDITIFNKTNRTTFL